MQRRYAMRVPVLSAIALLMATAPLHAENPRQEKFRNLDSNHDGKLTRDEFSGHPGNFRAMDCDDDRFVTEAEFVAPYECDQKLGRTSEAERRFEAKDKSNDGLLSRSEWRDEDLSFQSVDADGDGVVSRQEYLSRPGSESRPDASFADLDDDRDGRLSRGEWHGDSESFRRADRDGDGYVERREFGAAGRAVGSSRFDDLDRDGDGRIEWTEWEGDDDAFRVLDANGDEVLSRSEVRSTRALSRRFSELDDDRTGNLSRREWPGDPDRFARLDRNGDGSLSREEYLPDL
jgi:Ca2+-binding EF-hand superfamily protein